MITRSSILVFSALFLACTSDVTAVDAGKTPADANQGASALALQLEEGTVALNDYRGVIAGPSPNSTNACSYATETTLAEKLYQVGIRSIRNNDYYDDSLDLDLMFNCSGKAYGSNTACENQYPCWKGCALTYPIGCGAMQYTSGATNGYTSDRRFESMTKGGFEPFLRVGGEYNVAAGTLQGGVTARTAKGPQTDEEEANWIEAAKCAAEHYQSKTAFPYLNIITETSEHFWSRGWPAFHKFWVKAFSALKSTFGSQFKIGGPGMWGPNWTISTVKAHEEAASCTASASLPARDFLKAVAAAGEKPDWLGIHIFSSDPDDYARTIAAFKALLSKSGPCFGASKTLESPWAGDYFAKAELIVDAYMPSKNVLFTGEAIANSVRFYDGKEGAALNASSFVVFQREGITRAYHYRASEQASGGPLEGIIKCDATASAKPRANVYRLWNRMMDASARQGTILSPANDSKLYVLYASATKRYVLVANTGDAAVTYAPSWKTGSTSVMAHRARSLYTVDDSNDGSIAAPMTDDAITIPAQTVHLLELE